MGRNLSSCLSISNGGMCTQHLCVVAPMYPKSLRAIKYPGAHLRSSLGPCSRCSFSFLSPQQVSQADAHPASQAHSLLDLVCKRGPPCLRQEVKVAALHHLPLSLLHSPTPRFSTLTSSNGLQMGSGPVPQRPAPVRARAESWGALGARD